jgi:transcriptional regulator GlxA family with amidase domain
MCHPDLLSSGAGHEWQQRKAAARISKAVAYMLANLKEPVRIADLSKLTGSSTSNFYHLFKVATGCSPNDFFIRARMERACELLQSTDLSVKEVAALLGYYDQFYFSRVFKSVHHVPPSHYRTVRAPSPERTRIAPIAGSRAGTDRSWPPLDAGNARLDLSLP